jgi:hypothetical protein
MDTKQEQVEEQEEPLTADEQLQALCDFVKEHLFSHPVVEPEQVVQWLAEYLFAGNLADVERLEEIKELKKKVQEYESKISVLEAQLRSTKVLVEVGEK